MEDAYKPWNEQGCPSCRDAWLSGSREGLLHLGTSNEQHTRLYQCKACGSYWQEMERYAQEVSVTQAGELRQHDSFRPA